jgi:hypothetical protein
MMPTTPSPPVPDPTLLTTENLRREISNLKELTDTKFAGINDLFSSELEKLASVTSERFTAVGAQFTERDTRTDQRAGDTKLAVDAAFAAAKEATAKIEAGFTKSIDGQQELMNTNTKASDEKISDLKDRITAIESRTQGLGAARSEGRDNQNDTRGFVFGMVGMVIGMGALILTVMTHVMK